MAFVVKFAGESTIEFHRDKPGRCSIGNVVWFSADGHELDAVRSQFENLPITNGTFCRWSGELAEFIFMNLVCDAVDIHASCAICHPQLGQVSVKF